MNIYFTTGLPDCLTPVLMDSYHSVCSCFMDVQVSKYGVLIPSLLSNKDNYIYMHHFFFHIKYM